MFQVANPFVFGATSCLRLTLGLTESGPIACFSNDPSFPQGDRSNFSPESAQTRKKYGANDLGLPKLPMLPYLLNKSSFLQKDPTGTCDRSQDPFTPLTR